MPKKKSSAAGPYLGFGLQTVRYCARLLSEPEDSVVYLEEDDDVSVRNANGSRTLEQCKSGLTQNPVSDWAKDLWKTIHNWLTEEAPSSDSLASLCLYVTPAYSGELAQMLHEASSDADAAAFLKALETRLTSCKKKPACSKYIQTLLKANADDKVALIKKFCLISQADPLDEIRGHFKKALDPMVIERVLSFALGEAKRQSDKLLRAKQPAAISAGYFQQIVRDFIRHTKLPTLELFAPEKPDEEAVQSTFASRPTFIRQLELVDASDDTKINAVSDYLHASSSKTKWGSDGTLLPESLDSWNDTLCRRHKAIFEKSKITSSHLTDIALGHLVYWQCLEIHVELDSRAVPNYFVSGCFNDLADRQTLGWHPNYKTHLK